jgi:MerR family transcriptional regulator, light-induced transcriptional regulator
MSQSLTLQHAADALGVHYMTAYRYVRTGRLPAFKTGVEWRVKVEDLAVLKVGPQTDRRGQRPRRWAVDQTAARLIAGDEPGVWALVETALTSGAQPAEIHLDLLAPALRSVGDRWASGQLSVAEEHRASVVAQRVVGRLGPMFARRGRRRGTVVIGAPPGEWHALPGAILADELRAARFEVVDLGANTPAVSFAEAARPAVRLVAVLVGATIAQDRAVGEVIEAVRAAAPGTPILVGGAAVADEAAAKALGADGWSGLDARQAVEAVNGLLPGRRRTTPP